MSFSRCQQGNYRPMVQRAWLAHCGRNAMVAGDEIARRSWYEEELYAATGKESTTKCDVKRDFEAAMAHFEAIWGGDFYWNKRLFGADARRIIHNIRDVAADFEVEESYLQGIAKRVLGVDYLPDLANVSYEDLATVMGELKRYTRSRLTANQPF